MANDEQRWGGEIGLGNSAVEKQLLQWSERAIEACAAGPEKGHAPFERMDSAAMLEQHSPEPAQSHAVPDTGRPGRIRIGQLGQVAIAFGGREEWFGG